MRTVCAFGAILSITAIAFIWVIAWDGSVLAKIMAGFFSTIFTALAIRFARIWVAS